MPTKVTFAGPGDGDKGLWGRYSVDTKVLLGSRTDSDPENLAPYPSARVPPAQEVCQLADFMGRSIPGKRKRVEQSVGREAEAVWEGSPHSSVGGGEVQVTWTLMRHLCLQFVTLEGVTK